MQARSVQKVEHKREKRQPDGRPRCEFLFDETADADIVHRAGSRVSCHAV